MPVVHVRLFQELNDYIPPSRRAERMKCRFELVVEPATTITSLLMRLAIPPEVVDLVTVDGESVPLTFQPGDNAEVNIYPVFERFDVGDVTLIRSVPLRQPRFELDGDLEELARLLGRYGFDAAFRAPFDHQDLVERARKEHRIVLSRNRDVICNRSDAGVPVHDRSLTHFIQIDSANPRRQLEQVLSELQLDGAV